MLKWLDEYFEESLLTILLVLISAVMLAQVFARYVFNNSMTWPEEFCRYCYVWTVFLSLGFTLKKGSMLRVGVVMDLFPAKIQNAVKIFCDFVMLALFAVFLQRSLGVVANIKNVTKEISSAMRIPMWLMYTCTTAGFGMSVIRTLQIIANDVRNFNVKARTTIEATMEEARAETELASQDDASHGANGG
ncbi:MAG: TRAP transporter small permease [Synergistaceae bacterium]|jgi:TRAP-type C4-dicarboxylate transport system permease small subunit|nr:TRAP transporter small permease [Synergistaceae bacterium]